MKQIDRNRATVRIQESTQANHSTAGKQEGKKERKCMAIMLGNEKVKKQESKKLGVNKAST